ncbi:barren [Hortaea werneckii]|nr:barren [Hortaea werneckii]KAI7100767.1 barren [Hortaea werneckii]KAI7229071.1 barren [Hortaea werneckii]KAI7306331.1 barren [Hortaea werneckii]KAI7374843.1 barren [Hortaea werneckii]
MPRVRGAANASYASPVKSPTKTVQIPLNDDDEERAQRNYSRKSLHAKQLEQLKAAASPARKRKSVGPDGPHTPSQEEAQYDVAGTAVTPMKRVPILANFEEWMKMATDNKINATNSWNFALIDYFHDMSLLREGDSVNFQKASCTLDGCVKIYTSRVDSVATETGKLLSGLADSGGKKRRGGGDGEEAEGDDGEEDEEGEDGAKKPRKKRAARSAEATLAASFEQLRLKKMELEFSVDPLFKKASADFDEGGAKGLLLNHLSIDSSGRIVFDSSDDAQEIAQQEDGRRDSMEPEGQEGEEEATDDKTKLEEESQQDGFVDMGSLASRFFPDLDKLDGQDLCPSLKTFELGAGDGSLDLPFLKAPENWRDEHPELDNQDDGDNDSQPQIPDDGPAFGMDDDDEEVGGGFDMPPDTGFGEGGEAWARDAARAPGTGRVHDAFAGAESGAGEGEEGGEVGTFDANGQSYGVTLQHRDHDQENILNYFDAALHKNWAGPEHWKIARIKEASKPTQPQRQRKEKEPFEIDFSAPMSSELATQLYTKASSNAAISLPRNQCRSKTRNLLPDDKHFNSKDLLRLFLKPKAKLSSRRPGHGGRSAPGPPEHGEVDEAYWAQHNGNAANPLDEEAAGVQGDYDANFFADDNLPMPAGADMDDDPDEFADAQDHFSPEGDNADAASAPLGAGIDSVEGAPSSQGEGDGAFGVNLVTQSRRMRPEYVQYARTAKRVDMRRLKQEMWGGIGCFDSDGTSAPPPQSKPPGGQPQIPQLQPSETGELKFVDIMNNLQHVYPKQQMQDISTSYGFICLLHLANEKGLVIENVDGWQDLTVRKDDSAVDLEHGD